MTRANDAAGLGTLAGPTGVIRWVARVPSASSQADEGPFGRTSTPRTDSGLLDLEMVGHEWYRGPRLVRADELAKAPYPYVILAPGGMGKSTLLDEMRALEPTACVIDLALSTSLAADVKAAIDSGRPCYVDAIDEALLDDPRIDYKLAKLLGEPGARSVKWRLACRPASWSDAIERALKTALPDFRTLELQPLDMEGVRALASQVGVGDVDGFTKAAEGASLSRLLANPMHAVSLMEAWTARGQLPVSQAESMAYSVKSLLSERGPFRPGQQQSAEQILVTAERLATITMFSEATAFTAGNQGADSRVLAASTVPGDEEPGFGLLAPDGIREVLGTSLFSAAAPGAVSFVHQSYAEYLTATYLKRRNVGHAQLASLLNTTHNPIIAAPLLEVLGWLLAVGVDVPDAIVVANSKRLLATDGATTLPDTTRASLVAAILRGTASGAIDEGWTADTSVLAHPHLDKQLHDTLTSAQNRWELFWICRIARDCRVSGFVDDLVDVAFSADRDRIGRVEALRALGAWGTAETRARLAPLLSLGRDEDPEDEIHGATLRAMLPDAITDEQLTAAIRPVRAEHYIGGYSMLLNELSDFLRPGQVLIALKAALPLATPRTSYRYQELIAGLLGRAWEHDPASVAKNVASELAAVANHLRQDLREKLPWLAQDDPGPRRTLAAAVMTAPDGPYAALHLHLVSSKDLAWLLDWFKTISPEEQEAADPALWQLANQPADAAAADLVLSLSPDHPAHPRLASLQGTCEIADRPSWFSRAAEDEERERTTQRDNRARIASLIQQVNDQPTAWWRLAVALAGDPETLPDGCFEWDLTARQGWGSLDESERAVTVASGLLYLAAHRPDPSPWRDLTSYFLEQVMPDWAGVHLIATLAAHYPDLLDTIPRKVWTTWASTIIETKDHGSNALGHATIRDAVSPEVQQFLNSAFVDYINNTSDDRFAQHDLADVPDPLANAALRTIAEDPSQPLIRRDAALGLLLRHDPGTALDVSRVVTGEPDPPETAFEALGAFSPEELIAPWIANQAVDVRARLRHVDPEFLSERSLTSLTGIVLDSLPFADDPAIQAGVWRFGDDPDDEPRRVRTRLLQVMADRGMAEQLKTLREGREPRTTEVIGHMLNNAREQHANREWSPLDPAEVVGVISHADARLIRTDADLQAVLLEQLSAIQHEIKSKGGFRDLWNGDPGQPHPHDKPDATPKSENDISDWLQRQLDLRLTPHVVIDREIEVLRVNPAGVGTRMDLTATAGGQRLGRVAVEAKHTNNPELMTAIGEQLVADYLEPQELTCGIFLVYWVAPHLRPKKWSKRKWPDKKQLADKLAAQANAHAPLRMIAVFILDVAPDIP